MIKGEDYFSLTDIAKQKNPLAPADVVKNWMRSKMTIQFLGLWESINNDNFKLVEFDQFEQNSGTNAFTLSPMQWIEKTGAKGIISSSGNNGGTFAHKDIAMEFASWISPEFKLYLIKEFQRLKEEESKRLSLDWQLNRAFSKINYKLQTDAIKQNLIAPTLSKQQEGYIYADEADVLNIILFGKTAKQWREENPDLAKKKENIRDYATLQQLLILGNLENFNSEMISKGIPQKQRFEELGKIAQKQLKSALNLNSLKTLDSNEED